MYSKKMDKIMQKLETAQTALRDIDEQRANQLAHRDELIVAALAEGHTWAKVQTNLGLSPRALALAIERHGKRI
jgi:transcriptional regulator with GAF, ATPase, and Fis domain